MPRRRSQLPIPSPQKIKERKVVQWGLAYLAGAWLVLQVVVALGGVYGWPTWLLRATPIVLGAGLFGALVLAWFHGEKGNQRVSGVEIGLLIAVMAVAGIGVALLAPAGASPKDIVDIRNLESLSDAQALDLAYVWGVGGNTDASIQILDHLIDRAESDSAKVAYLAKGASLLSRAERPDEAVAWMLRLMAIDPVSLTLASDAEPEITKGYLEAVRRHYTANARRGPVRSIAMLPQGAYMVGFPDSLAGVRSQLAEGLPTLILLGLSNALQSEQIPLLERAALDLLELGPVPIEEVRVGLPGSDWLWVDEQSMPGGILQASHYVLSYCTHLGAPFERGGGSSMTCSALLISTEGSGIRALAQSRGDLNAWSEIAVGISSSLAKQILP